MNEKLIDAMVKECLVLDIETAAFYPTGEPIDIRKQFEDYVKYAKVKWIGFYSYKYDKYHCIPLAGNEQIIKDYISEHKAYVGFNNDEFDNPVLYNNGLMGDYQNILDVMQIIGDDKFRGHKMRCKYMQIDLKPIEINGKLYGRNSLNGMAHSFNLETVKGDIDYEIFHKDSWTPAEAEEIKKYLKADLEVTKQLFDKLIEFWRIIPEMGWLYEDDILNWSWLRSSIASLTYKSACKVKGVQPTYGEKGDTEEMGGRAIEPPFEEIFNVWYFDEKSKYPHLFAEFNLFNEVDPKDYDPEELQRLITEGKIFHGNEVFKVKGYYEITEQGVLEKDILEKLEKRFAIQKTLKTEDLPDSQIKILNAIQYMIKIFLNALYGVVRSAIFEQLHSENAGWDCCWLGQQVHEFVEKEFNNRGYQAVGGFTDSWFIKAKESDTEEGMKQICKEIFDKLRKYMPFPAESHYIDVECFMDYVMYHYDEKKKEYKKNNYCFISTKRGEKYVKVVGFPIKKSNATKLGKKLYKEYLEPRILQEGCAKFPITDLKNQVQINMEIKDMIIKYDCKPAEAYKDRVTKEGLRVPSSNIYAQVSRGYTDGLGGVVYLIKNKKAGQIGNAIAKVKTGKKLGKADWFYGTLEECEAANVTIEDLDLTKIYNELAPFCKGGKIV